MFILQTEMPHYFDFKTNIGKSGELEFYIEDRKIKYESITKFINDEIILGETKNQEIKELIAVNSEKLENLKIQVSEQEIEYRAKEKQISTFLECKKTFFGKFKYYFKYSKKKNKGDIKERNQDEENKKDSKVIKKQQSKVEITEEIKSNYTIEELLQLYREIEKSENELKNIMMDLNSLKLKNKNMEKKIKNATLFIEDIDKHKKSIFEFWRFTNKDELTVLPEGEEEVVDIIKKITKVFDYEEDFEEFGNKMDQIQRKKLTKQETDSLYICMTKVLEILNKIKSNTVLPKDIQESLKELKQSAKKEKTLTENDEFDIFGSIIQDSSKISKIKDKKHRELAKDKYSILDINKNTKPLEYKLSLERIINYVENAIEKVKIIDDIPIYKATEDKLLDEKEINIFDVNPESEIKEILKKQENKINFYKINLKKGVNGISFTNSIFYDNQNKTLPIGQDISTKILVDLSKFDMKLKNRFTFKILDLGDENDDFANIAIKNVNVFEYDL